MIGGMVNRPKILFIVERGGGNLFGAKSKWRLKRLTEGEIASGLGSPFQ